jgi:hypothetical protein
MRLARSTFAYEETQAFLGEAPENPLIKSYLVQYLLVSLYSEIEEHVKKVIQGRINLINDSKVASFVFKSNEGMLKRVKKAEINDVLQKFDCGTGDVISEILGDMNLQPYFDMITNRHLVSHNDGGSMTLDYFGQALPCAEAVLDALETALAAD